MTARIRHRSARGTSALRLRTSGRARRRRGTLGRARRNSLAPRVIAGIAACALGAILFVVFTTPTAQQLITKDLSARLNRIKDAGADIMKDIEGSSAEQFKKIGVDPDEFAKVYLSDFDYRIGGIKVDGDKATTEVTVSARRLNGVLSEFSAAYQQEIRSRGEAPTGDEAASLTGKLLVKAAEGTELEDRACTIEYHRDEGGAWHADDSSWSSELASALGSQADAA